MKIQNNKNNILLKNLNLIEHLKSLLDDKDKGVINEDCIICNNGQQKKFVMNNIYLTSEIVIINIIRIIYR